MSTAPAPEPLSEAESRSIRDFQARKAQFQPRWTRNIGLVFLPGIVLFALGGGLVDLLLSGREGRFIPWLFWPGVLLCVTGMVRGALLLSRHLRCPQCDHWQKPGWRHPYRSCLGCGARLSTGIKDSR